MDLLRHYKFDNPFKNIIYMKQQKLALAAFTVLAFVAARAHATGSASVNLTNVNVMLYSTDSTIIPTIVFNSSASSRVVAIENEYGNLNYQSEALNITQGIVSVIAGNATATIGPTLNAIGSPGFPSFNVSASGVTTNISNGTSGAYFDVSGPFTLSANTVAVFEAQVASTSTSTVGYNPVTWRSETASTIVTMEAVLSTGSGDINGISTGAGTTLYYSDSGYSSKGIANIAVDSVQSNSRVDDMTITVANTTGNSAAGYFYLDGGASGSLSFVSVVPIPEPKTYAMLIGGLALIGCMVSRRKSS